MRIISGIFTLLLIFLGIAFSALNAKEVTVNYLIGTRDLPLAAVLLMSLSVGILLSISVMGWSILKLKAKNKWLESKLRRTQEQLTNPQE